jgi:flagellum-specific ATP synthase
MAPTVDIMPQFLEQLDHITPTAIEGSIVEVTGVLAAAADFPVMLGATVEIDRAGREAIPADVVGFRENLTLLYPHQNFEGIRRGSRVRLVRSTRTLAVGDELLGRVVDCRGQAIDGRPQPFLNDRIHLMPSAISALRRPRITEPLATGVRAIDGLVSCGKGQRLGIFAPSGLGKSVLLAMIAKYTSADVNVVALVGERGREVNDFLERSLGPAGLARSVVVVATSDEPAVARLQAAQTATAVAEYFRDRGRDVLLLVDSLTRVATAQREIGLASGEAPAARGFPPSVFALLPRLLERAGRTETGSITAFYNVLVEGDDPHEPISDATRSLLDGHVCLSRTLTTRAHWPAIDVLESLSRLMPEVTDREHQEAANTIRELLAAYRDHADLISIGAYKSGANRRVDVALHLEEEINRFLRQRIDEPASWTQSHGALVEIQNKAAALLQTDK